MTNIEKFPEAQPGPYETDAKPPNDGKALDPFDLESIKARPEDYGTITTKKMPDEIAVGRPNPKAYIRVHPDHHIDLPLVIDKAKDQHALVMPSARALLPDDIVICTVFLYVTTDGKPGLWPIPISDNAWHESAFEAAREAEHTWLRVIPKTGRSGHYAIKKAEGEIDPPEWPKMEPVADVGRALPRRDLGRRF
jgi:hypothetical protein